MAGVGVPKLTFVNSFVDALLNLLATFCCRFTFGLAARSHHHLALMIIINDHHLGHRRQAELCMQIMRPKDSHTKYQQKNPRKKNKEEYSSDVSDRREDTLAKSIMMKLEISGILYISYYCSFRDV